MIPHRPIIRNSGADAAFRALAAKFGLDPDNQWVGHYVDYEWDHGRYAFEALPDGIAGRSVLEFGCNCGATAIVLAALGASVTAVDVDANCIRLAEINAARYGFSERIDVLCTPDTTHLPFASQLFDVVTCNSVFEYVPHRLLPRVQKDIDRVLRPGGLIVILGTSNRLWPREVHSRRWLTNYLPRGIERLWGGEELQRGVFPWQLRSQFGPGYENLDCRDNGQVYLELSRRRGDKGLKRAALVLGQRIVRLFGSSIGLYTPSISIGLRKAANPPR